METSVIIGRHDEIRQLDNCYKSGESEFIILYGRRRVGKTFLIRKHFEGKFDFVLTGIHNGAKAVQLGNFANTLEEYSGMAQDVPETWFEAFNQLKRHLSTLRKQLLLVFIDEMPWLDTKKSDFLAAFELFWNGWGASQSKLMLIVCGSATTWITDKIFANKGGLFNRATKRAVSEIAQNTLEPQNHRRMLHDYGRHTLLSAATQPRPHFFRKHRCHFLQAAGRIVG